MIIPIYMNLHSRLFAKSNFTAINDEGKTKPEVEGKAKTEWQNIFPIFNSKKKKSTFVVYTYCRVWRTFAQAKE